MFSIQHTDQNGLQQVLLANTHSGCKAAIIPALGAMLNEFSVLHRGQSINVTEGYSSKADYDENKNWFRSAKLSPFGCRIANAQYQFNGNDYTLQKFLFNGDAMHGLLYDLPFEIVNTAAGTEVASVTLLCCCRNEDPGYPFSYNCTVTYTLQ
jgi:aldose 1-epimerase